MGKRGWCVVVHTGRGAGNGMGRVAWGCDNGQGATVIRNHAIYELAPCTTNADSEHGISSASGPSPGHDHRSVD